MKIWSAEIRWVFIWGWGKLKMAHFKWVPNFQILAPKLFILCSEVQNKSAENPGVHYSSGVIPVFCLQISKHRKEKKVSQIYLTFTSNQYCSIHLVFVACRMDNMI